MYTLFVIIIAFVPVENNHRFVTTIEHSSGYESLEKCIDSAYRINIEHTYDVTAHSFKCKPN